jgi:hypothetical protein
VDIASTYPDVTMKPVKPNRRRGVDVRAGKHNERWVLVAIAVLFVANVLLYLCHHFRSTSLDYSGPRSGAIVILD